MTNDSQNKMPLKGQNLSYLKNRFIKFQFGVVFEEELTCLCRNPSAENR